MASRFDEAFAGVAWPALVDQLGESVSYSRMDGGSVATGFPKALMGVWMEENRHRGSYEDGEGDPALGVLSVEVSDIGGAPEIENDRVVVNGLTWVVTRVREVSGGVAVLECERFVSARKSGRAGRIER
jgi:hypothetical protein